MDDWIRAVGTNPSFTTTKPWQVGPYFIASLGGLATLLGLPPTHALPLGELRFHDDIHKCGQKHFQNAQPSSE